MPHYRGAAPRAVYGAMVRRRHGLRRTKPPDEAIHYPSSERCGLWHTSGGAPGGTILAPAYLHTGMEDGDSNLQLLYELGAALQAMLKHYIVGAGWQMEPHTLESTGWVASINGRIHRPFRPTCYTKKEGKTVVAREIDYFVLSDTFIVSDTAVRDSVNIRPHRAVQTAVRAPWRRAPSSPAAQGGGTATRADHWASPAYAKMG